MLFTTFCSLRQAGLVILNIPFAMIGDVVSLNLSGLYLSVPASVGFITLFGVAVFNGVVMVSYFNLIHQLNLLRTSNALNFKDFFEHFELTVWVIRLHLK